MRLTRPFGGIVSALAGTLLAIQGGSSFSGEPCILPTPVLVHRPVFNPIEHCLPCPFAHIEPAPPSSPAFIMPDNREPPLLKSPTPGKGPTISHSRTVGGTTEYTERPEPLCKVSFWNQTGADVDLTVNDRVTRVLKERGTVLTLSRDFSWKTPFQAEKREEVPSDANYFDIVIK